MVPGNEPNNCRCVCPNLLAAAHVHQVWRQGVIWLLGPDLFQWMHAGEVRSTFYPALPPTHLFCREMSSPDAGNFPFSKNLPSTPGGSVVEVAGGRHQMVSSLHFNLSGSVPKSTGFPVLAPQG
jgi:hypothetical protein